jgi:hypothetical protein
VAHKAVGLLRIARLYLLKVFLKYVLWYLGVTKLHDLYRTTMWTLSNWIVLNPTSKIVFLSINSYSSVPDWEQRIEESVLSRTTCNWYNIWTFFYCSDKSIRKKFAFLLNSCDELQQFLHNNNNILNRAILPVYATGKRTHQIPSIPLPNNWTESWRANPWLKS